jgi:hypothetical protein
VRNIILAVSNLDNFALKNNAQGTIEYLLIIGIIVIISLSVIGLVTGFINLGPSVSVSNSRLAWQSSPVGLSDAGIDGNGNSFFVVTNNTGETITLTGYKVNGELKDFSTEGVLPTINMGEKKVIFIAKQNACQGSICSLEDLSFTYRTASGLEKNSTQNDLAVEKQNNLSMLNFSSPGALICVNSNDVGVCGSGGSSGGSGTDTNWQTSFTAFDSNMIGQYRKYTVDINTTENVNADKNMNVAGHLNVAQVLNVGDVNFLPPPAPTPVYQSSFATAPTTATRFDGTSYAIGFRFQVTRQITVTKLGRLFVSGNTQNHFTSLWISTSQSAPLRSGTILAASASDINGFKWVNITPIDLLPGNTYALVSDEVGGIDAWKDHWTPSMQPIFTNLVDALTNSLNGSGYPGAGSGAGMYNTCALYYTEAQLPPTQIIANLAVDGNGYFADTVTATKFKVGETPGITNDTNYWMCKDSSCSTKCLLTIKGGIITACN